MRLIAWVLFLLLTVASSYVLFGGAESKATTPSLTKDGAPSTCVYDAPGSLYDGPCVYAP